MTKRFVAGVVGAPFGLKGFVKVKPFSGEIDHLLKLKSVTLRQGEQERVFGIEESAAIPPALAIRFAGFHTPEAVRTLKGAELMVERKDAAPLQTGEFYIEDIKGLSVLLADGAEPLGHIIGIIEGGGGDLAELRLQNGETKLVPFRKEFFTNIDLEKKQLILHNHWVLE
jgi:16S rRNA processing protein RimM